MRVRETVTCFPDDSISCLREERSLFDQQTSAIIHYTTLDDDDDDDDKVRDTLLASGAAAAAEGQCTCIRGSRVTDRLN